ncbi:hypothetical protein GN156_00445 [bacterium LRH843]|nr:hypothetical protein [bacterium LRH843]
MSENEIIRKLVMYELKNTPVIKYVLTAFCIGLVVYLVGDFLESILDEGRLPVLYDILFLMVLSLPISTIRYKPFTTQNLKGEFYGSSFFILLKQTPISEKAIRKSRFIMTGLYTVVLNTLMFALLYLFSEQLQANLTVGQAIILCICWVSVSYIWGGVMAAAEPGGSYSMFALFIWLIVYLFVFIAIFTAFNLLFGAPFVIWSFEMAQTSPILLILLSVGIAIISTMIWIFEFKRYEKKADYHV